MKYGTTLYYTNEQTDEVINFKPKEVKIDEEYKYHISNPLYKIFSYLSYFGMAFPMAFAYKLFKNVKFIDIDKLKNQNTGFFVYANHTNKYGDAFLPHLICHKKPYTVVNSANLNIVFWGKFLKMWGALPIPSTINATKNFNDTIEKQIKNGHPILIYPEAHLWPYYTKIRNFTASSFRFPVKLNKPVFVFTTVYKVKKYGKKPKIEIYIDGPIYPNSSLNPKDAQQELRNNVYNTMLMRSKNSNYEYVKYIKKDCVW